MANITREGFETCMAFGKASLAVADVAELLRGQNSDGPAGDLLGELEDAHHRLRDQFDLEEDGAVHALALRDLVLAAWATEAIREDRNRPDGRPGLMPNFLSLDLRSPAVCLRRPPATATSALSGGVGMPPR